jgi:hypothetical protein
MHAAQTARAHEAPVLQLRRALGNPVVDGAVAQNWRLQCRIQARPSALPAQPLSPQLRLLRGICAAPGGRARLHCSCGAAGRSAPLRPRHSPCVRTDSAAAAEGRFW